MWLCQSLNMYIWVCAWVCLCMYVWMSECACICSTESVSTWLSDALYVFLNICVHVSEQMCVSLVMCLRVYISVYMPEYASVCVSMCAKPHLHQMCASEYVCMYLNSTLLSGCWRVCTSFMCLHLSAWISVYTRDFVWQSVCAPDCYLGENICLYAWVSECMYAHVRMHTGMYLRTHYLHVGTSKER